MTVAPSIETEDESQAASAPTDARPPALDVAEPNATVIGGPTQDEADVARGGVETIQGEKALEAAETRGPSELEAGGDGTNVDSPSAASGSNEVRRRRCGLNI